MWRGVFRLGAGVLLLALLLVSCSDQSADTAPNQSTTSREALDQTASPSCEIPPGQDFEITAEVELELLGSTDGATVYGATYPHPDYEGNPWSHWGQGVVAENGYFYSAIGDHLGPDGNSYIYEYQPETRRLALVSDVLSHTDHNQGQWGYGKVHSQMVEGDCGEILFSTYWGSSRGLEYSGTYTGDILFRLNPVGATIEALTVPISEHGTPSLAIDPQSGLLYGEAADPKLKADGVDGGPFYVFDIETAEVIYEGPDQPHVGFRSILVDADGGAFYSTGDGNLVRYDPSTSETSEFSGLPGGWIRAATLPSADGTVFGVTREPDRFFSMEEPGEFEALSDALGYTTSLALDPDGSRFFYMPGAHGNSSEWGSPLIAVDTSTGDQDTIIELNEIVEDALGYTVGGTYNVAVSDDGDEIYMAVNVGAICSDSTFGEVVLLVIELT